MLEKVKEIFHQTPTNVPHHVALTTSGVEQWALDNKESVEKANAKSFENIRLLIHEQVRFKIPWMTFYLLREEMDKESSQFSILIDAMIHFFTLLSQEEVIHSHHVKISVIGKWYSLPSRVIDPIKAIVESTRDYSDFSLNFCINYDGQEEIVDACLLIGKQIEGQKRDPESLTKEIIKENLYSSHFPPVNLLIKNGKKHSTHGFLLWDSAEAHIYFSDVLWPDFTVHDFEKALRE